MLAGIAICRKGFPNKMLYPEFKARYNILAAKLVAKAKNDKAAASAVLDIAVKLDKEKFRLGHTKVFFRAGILGYMEEVREDKIGSVLAWLQSGARGKASRMQFKKLQDQKLALYCCQRAIRNLMIAKTWKWMQIWLAIKPNLKCTQFSKYKKEYEDKIGSVLSWLQSGARGKASRMQFKKLQDQKLALYACQRAIKTMMIAKTWLWMQLWLAIKPNLKCTQFGKYKKEYEDKIAEAEANIDRASSECQAVVDVHTKLAAEKNELVLALQSGGSAVQVC